MKKLSNIKLTLISILFTLIFSGCSTKTYTISKEYKDSMKKSKNIALISDSCIFHDEIGEDNDYFSIYKSKKSTTLLNAVIKEKFNNNGLNINYLESRAICTSLKNTSTDINIKVDENSSIQKSYLPYFYTKIEDKKYQEALKNILINSQKTAIEKENFEEVFFANKSIEKSLKIFKNKSKQSKLLVLINNGKEVSAGKSLGQGILTAVLTAGLISTRNIDFMDSYAVLIDIEEKKVLWRSAVRLKKSTLFDFEKSWYENKYYDTVLKSLIDNLK